ncbi:MAG: mechanosensitive ion channel [Armatimonadota bacterium]|nr:mechanosensitive ion channel [Armatimonadota bacterium]
MEGFYEYVRDVWLSPWPRKLAYAILAAAVFELILYVTGRMIRRAVAPALRRDAGREPSERVRRRRIVEGIPLKINSVIWHAMAFLMILRIFGLKTGAEVIPVTAGVLVVALVAGKNVLRDAVRGYLITYDNLYAPGDQITVGQVSGIVTELSLRNTVVRTSEGREITVPNSQVMLVAGSPERQARASPGQRSEPQ